MALKMRNESIEVSEAEHSYVNPAFSGLYVMHIGPDGMHYYDGFEVKFIFRAVSLEQIPEFDCDRVVDIDKAALWLVATSLYSIVTDDQRAGTCLLATSNFLDNDDSNRREEYSSTRENGEVVLIEPIHRIDVHGTIVFIDSETSRQVQRDLVTILAQMDAGRRMRLSDIQHTTLFHVLETRLCVKGVLFRKNLVRLGLPTD